VSKIRIVYSIHNTKYTIQNIPNTSWYLYNVYLLIIIILSLQNQRFKAVIRYSFTAIAAEQFCINSPLKVIGTLLIPIVLKLCYASMR